MRRRRLSTAAIAIAVLLLTAVALARPGGGHSYGGGGGGGGGGSSGGGGGSGGGDGVGLLVYIIIQLLFEAPEIGVPLLIVVFFVWWWRSRVESSERGWDTTSSAPEPSFEVHRWQPPEEHAISPRNTLQRLREDDPDFSLIVFEDFLQAFWGELLIAQGSGRTETLMPWLTKRAFDNLPFLGDVDSVTTPIVGAITYRDVEFTGDRVLVRVHIEGMYSARHNGVVHSFWVRDHWRLERARTARSRSPDRVAVFTCPNCGAPAESARTGRCSYCSEIVNDGRFDWVLGNAVRDMSEQRPPQLTSDVAESGTENETVKAPDVAQQLQALAREPSFSHEKFQARVRLAFHEVQTGWRDGDLARIRPWVTDRQFESMRWWLDAYRAAGLRNISNNAITRLETVRVTRDRWYDALTVRVHATGTDYTIDTRGNVVSGSQVQQRPFSEYWTMIRGRTATGPARADKACPRCGAPLAINMAGSCAHCGAHVVSGDFDWVLSRIEQDDAYAG